MKFSLVMAFIAMGFLGFFIGTTNVLGITANTLALGLWITIYIMED